MAAARISMYLVFVIFSLAPIFVTNISCAGQVYGGVLQAGGHGAGAGPRLLPAVRPAEHHGASVADRWEGSHGILENAQHF